MDEFGAHLGCTFFLLSGACMFLFVTVAVLSGLIIAGVL